ncbi:MAG: hypothetical protein ABSB61_10330 [Anaerolineales bacterium]
MQRKPSRSDAHTEMGRQLASQLYDYKLGELVNLSPAEKSKLEAKFPQLDEAEFGYVVEQVIAARRYEQERVGWQAVPHDLAVLVFVALTCLVNLRVGAIVGVGALVLLEGLFQFYFVRPMYRFLSALVWLTYPAYVLVAYVLYHRGYAPVLIVAIVALTWGGSYVFGIVARLPLHLFLEARAKGAEEAAKRKRR